jgi:hypothetical protein
MKLIGLYEVLKLQGVLAYHTTSTFKTIYAPPLKLFEIHLLEQELTLAGKKSGFKSCCMIDISHELSIPK